MTYQVGQTITLPAFEDMPAFTANIIEIVDEVLCFIRSDGEYGEIELEALEEMLEAAE
ncbi:MAG: hypothetical protein P8P35_13050 [Planktotalea sp.]|uniref:hypothetical protein n=1 Tax=Planktotalea sp. TaxID=2029877 RepID=UPI002614D591|nr:hypothetical protein [Planktotalea sp.]MDG1085013.1 hypothetical protein [Planktotalea sp.]